MGDVVKNVGYEYENGEVLSFAIGNDFTVQMSKVAYAVGTKLTPFCMFAVDFQKANNVTDFMNFGGIVNTNITLADDIVRFMLQKTGTPANDIDSTLATLTEEQKKALCVRYMLSVSICYVEVDKWKTSMGERVHTYDKFLCTSNTRLLAEWLGDSHKLIEMEGKYGTKLLYSDDDVANDVIHFVKCNQTAKGNSLTAPRNAFKAKDIRLVPLFMLYAYQEGIYKSLEDSLVKFTFIKDNKTERTMISTLSEDIVRSFYTDNEVVEKMLSGIDVRSVKQGGMYLSSKAHRGFVRIPEIGASKYDNSGTRSLNLARIIKMQKVDASEVDTRYINVDLDSVIYSFQKGIDALVSQRSPEVRNIYKALTEGKGRDLPEQLPPLTFADECMKEVTMKHSMFSTEYLRWLHNFMYSHPEWFGNYTGERVEQAPTTSASDFVTQELDW